MALRRLLVRDYIQHTLYGQGGYFCRHLSPVGQLPAPLDFSIVLGEAGYRRKLAELYQQLQVSWVTPSELFRPHWGRAIARAMLSIRQRHAVTGPLVVYEVGAGAGTMARDVMDYVAEHHPDVYKKMRYTSVEISPSLAAIQQQTAEAHSARFAIEQRNALDGAGWLSSPARSPNGAHCFVLLMEVLDNLPHDRIARSRPFGSDWQETWVSIQEDSMSEEVQPLQDRLITEALSCMELRQPVRSIAGRVRDWVHGTAPAGSRSTIAWVPTGCLQLLTALHKALPQHTVIAADFSSLPGVQVPGWGAPIVSSQVAGRAVDHDTYLVPQGSADIFFPTDFQNLRQLYKHAGELAENDRVAECGSYWASTARFMTVHAERNGGGSECIGGYNPLLEDFANTAVFVGSSHDKCSVCTARDEC